MTTRKTSPLDTTLVDSLFEARETGYTNHIVTKNELEAARTNFDAALIDILTSTKKPLTMVELTKLLFPLDLPETQIETDERVASMMKDAWLAADGFPTECIDADSIHVNRRSNCVRFTLTTVEFTSDDLVPFLFALSTNPSRGIVAIHGLVDDDFNNFARIDTGRGDDERTRHDKIMAWARALEKDWGPTSSLAENVDARDEMMAMIHDLRNTPLRALPKGLDDLARGLTGVANRPKHF